MHVAMYDSDTVQRTLRLTNRLSVAYWGFRVLIINEDINFYINESEIKNLENLMQILIVHALNIYSVLSGF